MGRGGLSGVRQQNIDVDLGGRYLAGGDHHLPGGGHRSGLCATGDPAGQHPAVGSIDRDDHAVGQVSGRSACADDAGHLEFARHDRGVACHAPGIGHQCRGAAHGRQPVRIGHLGHQHFAVLQSGTVADVAEHPHHSGCRARNRGKALDQHVVALGRGLPGPTQGGDRTGLHDVGLTIGDRPLGVLRTAGMLLAADCDRGDLAYLGVVEHLRLSLRLVEFDALVLAIRPANDLEGFQTDAAGQDLTAVLGHHVGVGLDRSGHHHLTLTEGGFDDHPVGGIGGGVGGECDTGTLRGDHQLNHHRHRRVGGEVPTGPIGHHPGPEQ